MAAGDAAWQDYVFQVDVRSLGSVNHIVRFRMTDKDNYYQLNFRAAPWNDVYVFKFVAGVRYLVAVTSHPIPAGVTHAVKIGVTGSSIHVYFDGNEALSTHDTTHPSGHIALETYSGGVVQFQDIYYDNVFVRDMSTSEVLLDEDFEDGTADGFWPVEVFWEIVGGTLHGHIEGFEFLAGMASEETSWTDYTLTLDASCSGAKNIGLQFRRQTSIAYYELQLRAVPYSDAHLYKFIDGQRNLMASVTCDVWPDHWHRIAIDAAGPAIAIALDQQPILAIVDDDRPYLTGGFELLAYSGGAIQLQDIYFDNVRVVAPAAPSIHSIEDVPDDQGGFLTLTWAASPFDDAGSPCPIIDYEVQRYAMGWETVLSLPAQLLPQYTAVVPTPAVLILGQPPVFDHLRVVAVPDDPASFFPSSPDSGYSIDNVPPPAPNLGIWVLPDALLLHWDIPGIPDGAEVCLYRDTVSGFAPGAPLVCQAIAPVGYLDDDPDYYYYVARFSDVHGNWSALSNEVSGTYLTSVNRPAPVRLAIRANHPNPFNAGTLVNFDIPLPGAYSLVVYDMRGREVRRFQGTAHRPGEFAQAWDGADQSGAIVPSGVYMVQLESKGGRCTRKITLAK
jgi:hypothetical protein